MKLIPLFFVGAMLTATTALASSTGSYDDTATTGLDASTVAEAAAINNETAYSTEVRDEDTVSVYATGFVTEVKASDLIGARIYTIEGELAEQEWFDINGGWRDVGEIEDLVISRDGSVEGVNVGVGGFLGVNETSRVVAMDVLQFWIEEVPENEGDFFVVISERVADDLTSG